MQRARNYTAAIDLFLSSFFVVAASLLFCRVPVSSFRSIAFVSPSNIYIFFDQIFIYTAAAAAAATPAILSH